MFLSQNTYAVFEYWIWVRICRVKRNGKGKVNEIEAKYFTLSPSNFHSLRKSLLKFKIQTQSNSSRNTRISKQFNNCECFETEDPAPTWRIYYNIFLTKQINININPKTSKKPQEHDMRSSLWKPQNNIKHSK